MNLPKYAILTQVLAIGFLCNLGVVTVAAMSATGPSVPGFEAYDRAIPALLEKWQVPGAALAVAYRGKIVFVRGYGFADREAGRVVQPDTNFRIMSCSKMLTASLVLKLVEDGQLSLDDHPFQLLNYPTPTYSGAHLDPRLAQITVRQLLSHSGGWVGEQVDDPFIGGRGFYPHMDQQRIAQVMGAPAPATAETLIRYLVGQPLQAAPGSVFSYCNQGYLILGRLIELKTGLTYEQAVQRFLASSYISNVALAGSRREELAPDEAVYYDYAGAPLATSQFDGKQVPKPYAFSLPGWDAAGGWKMSAIECVRFLLALDAKNEIPPLLRSESVSAMRTVQYPSTFYGFGWFTTSASHATTDGGHGGGSWGTKTYALRSANGEWHMALFLNSIPAEAFSGSLFESDAAAALHALPANFVPTDHDLTWSTLGWDAWQQLYFGSNALPEQADTDKDGASNLIEYSAGLDPTEIDPTPPATFVLNADGVPIFTYRRIVLEHPLKWNISSSIDGKTWTTVQTTPAEGGLNADGTLTGSLPMPGARHARLQVQRIASGVDAVYELTLEPMPIFTLDPVSLTTMEHNPVKLTAYASGEPTPTYQWQQRRAQGEEWANITDSGLLSGTVTKALTINSAVMEMSGDQFRCLAVNSVGSAVSKAATLTVVTATLPQFSIHPSGQTATTNSSVNFSCAASGAPLTYQWQKDGVAISGANTPSLRLTNLTLNDAGSYAVVATNTAGSVTSNAAILRVNSAPIPSSGGGGGAASPWVLAALALLGFSRRAFRKSR